MNTAPDLSAVYAEFEAGIALAKCQQCGCMQGALDGLAAALPALDAAEARGLAVQVATWSAYMRPAAYACLGCAHCFPAVGQNAFSEAFPSAPALALACEFRVDAAAWPPVAGEYVVLDPSAPVAVSTLSSVDLVDRLAAQQPAGLAIVGKTETENIGLDKIVKNVIANPALRFLLVCGREPAGHATGQTLLALAHNGADAQQRIVGAAGKRPVLRNVTAAEIAAFRQQVTVVDLIGCEEVSEIAARVTALAESAAPATCGCSECAETSAGLAPQPAVAESAAPAVCDCSERAEAAADPAPQPVAAAEACGCAACAGASSATVQTLVALTAPDSIPLDRAGYFVILPLPERGVMHVEHYAYDHTLLHIAEGREARSLYHLLIAQGWVSELSHAAYLGKELARAELSLQRGFHYLQDGA
jgi:tetrahydromethanopterin S-methyltransferase subunit A